MPNPIRCLAGVLMGVVLLIPANASSSAPYLTRYREICRIVTDHFYDPGVIRETFPAVEKAFRDRVEAIATPADFPVLVNEMLGRLGASHTWYLTPLDYEYYHLGAVFSKIPDIAGVFGNKAVTYPSIGIITGKIDGRHFIRCVLAGSVAEKSGFRCGDEICSVNGSPFSPVQSIKDQIGKTVIFRIRRSPDTPLMNLAVRPVQINPKKEMLDAEKASIRVIEQGNRKIGYIHIYSYAGREYHDQLVRAYTWGKLKNADALIIDLRFGFGGAGPEYLNIFNQDIPVLQMTDRSGKRQTFDSQWRKPAVYLANGATRSGKELLVFGAKKYGYATVIGEKTAGAVTAGRLFPLSNQDMIYLAVKACDIDGITLEGRGVMPDIEVPRDIRYCRGRDIQVEKAVAYLVDRLADEPPGRE